MASKKYRKSSKLSSLLTLVDTLMSIIELLGQDAGQMLAGTFHDTANKLNIIIKVLLRIGREIINNKL